MSAEQYEGLIAMIEGERGFVRQWPRLLARRDPEFTLKLHELANLALNRPGELPVKFREMILMALNAADECERGFRIHLRSALGKGATEGEILEVLEVVSILRLHGLTGMLSAFEEELQAFKGQPVHDRIQAEPGTPRTSEQIASKTKLS